MTRRLPSTTPPPWNPPSSGAKYVDLQFAIRTIVSYLGSLVLYMRTTLAAITEQVNTQIQSVGVDLPSAPVISPSAAIHHITGTATISTINAPSGFSGPLWLIADDAWSTDNAGNISRAILPAIGQAVTFVFDPAVALWFPSI